MAKLKLTKAKDRRPAPLKGAPADAARTFRDVDTDVSSTMTCGIVVHEKTLPWTVRYDEYYYLVEGRLRVRAGDQVCDMSPGDGLWIPKDTAIVYEPVGGPATAVYAVYPIDWRKHAGME